MFPRVAAAALLTPISPAAPKVNDVGVAARPAGAWGMKPRPVASVASATTKRSLRRMGLPPGTARAELGREGFLAERGDGHDRVGRWVVSQRSCEREVGETEDAAVAADHEVAGAVADHAGHRLVERLAVHGTPERRIAEGEDPAVGCHQPVARAAG